MSKFLVKETDLYRVGTEKEAETFIQELKQSDYFEVVKYTITKKQKKAKGEVVDEWIRLEVVKAFNDEVQPDMPITIDYEV